MNKIRPILLVWMAIISLAVNAQQNIERLLPTFAGLNDIDVTESIERGTWSQYEEPFYSVLIQNAHIDKIPTSLVDSLIVAFERELPLATESDRYQKHSEQGDTLSYTLAYNGTIHPADSHSRLNVMNHHYSQSIKVAAALDIENKTLRFHYNKVGAMQHLIWKLQTESDKTLADIFNEIAQDKAVKTVPVSYDIVGGDGDGNWQYMNSNYGYVHRKGHRIEVPTEKAADVFQRMFAAIAAMDRTQEVLSCSLSRNEANVVFGKHWSGDVYCLRRLDDGRVFVLHIEQPDKPCDLAIPYNWHEVDRISRMK
mgnify:CR=1 FL=1